MTGVMTSVPYPVSANVAEKSPSQMYPVSIFKFIQNVSCLLEMEYKYRLS